MSGSYVQYKKFSYWNVRCMRSLQTLKLHKNGLYFCAYFTHFCSIFVDLPERPASEAPGGQGCLKWHKLQSLSKIGIQTPLNDKKKKERLQNASKRPNHVILCDVQPGTCHKLGWFFFSATRPLFTSTFTHKKAKIFRIHRKYMIENTRIGRPLSVTRRVTARLFFSGEY